MKKLLALAGIALIAAACTNNDEPGTRMRTD